MVQLLLVVMFILMLLGLPIMFALFAAPAAVMLVYFPKTDLILLIQNSITGIQSFVMLSIPMFMMAGIVMCKGKMADRLIDLVKALLGSLPGGMAMTMGGACTVFGAVSGSAVATCVAIGKPMWKPMKQMGYSESHILGALVSNANIALLIPPSVIMILYCIFANASVADVFIAGITPGVLLFLVFAVYEYIYAKRHHIAKTQRVPMKQVGTAFIKAIPALGFPIIILGGIYTGFFSPTEAAAIGCLYAFVLEGLFYRSVKLKDIPGIALETAKVCAATLILTGFGNAFSWAISYAKIPQTITSSLLGDAPSQAQVFLAITLVFLVACCFIDSFPVIIITIPIFAGIAANAGINMVHLGVVVTLLSAIGCVTPPFGASLFTVSAAFNRKFTTIVKGVPVYLILTVLFTVIVIVFPQLSLWLLK